jgi:hypothetical protein
MGVPAGTWPSVALIGLTGEPGTTSDPLGLDGAAVGASRPRGESMQGTLADQVRRVHHEAGVREQL